jgi:hypothetical protein
MAATYHLLRDPEKTGGRELRLSRLSADGMFWAGHCGLFLGGATLRECVAVASAKFRTCGMRDDVLSQIGDEQAGLALTALLYLAGDPDVVRIIHPGEKPIKRTLARTDPDR